MFIIIIIIVNISGTVRLMILILKCPLQIFAGISSVTREVFGVFLISSGHMGG
jgi:hypothetical protein